MTGEVTVEDALAFQRQLASHPSFDPVYAQVTDCTGVTSHNLDAAGLRSIAMNAPYRPGARRAFVVGKDLGFGLGRMFQAYSEEEPRGDVGIFRDIGRAMTWALAKSS